MSLSPIILHVLGASEWERYRRIRLRALEECANAFASTIEQERAFSEADWRRRLESLEGVTIVANDPFAGDVGLVSGAPYDDAAGLYSMWVAPESRGKGLGGRLVDRLVEWARQSGQPKVYLDVGDWNVEAIALYRSKGFTRTGKVGALPPPREHILEHQRVLFL